MPPASRPAPLAAAQAAPGSGRRVGTSKSWLVLAGGGLFVAVAALAAWQFSGRRDATAVEQASAASASALAPAPAPATVPSPPIIVETADPSPASTLAAKTPVPTSSIAATAETAPRASIGDRAPVVDAGASSAARVRPPGKPVPRVGEDPALASSNGSATTRPLDSPTPGSPNASVNNERHPLPGVTPPRDYPGAQRPIPAVESGAASIRDVCKGSFFERNVCMDQRCEEARFRSTPECIDVIDRKRKRGQGQ